ncbi:MAG: hypothetical protein ACM3UU_03495 [Ignavibacteriales bacterium]
MNKILQRILIVVLIILGSVAGIELLFRGIFFLRDYKINLKNEKSKIAAAEQQVKTVIYPVLDSNGFYVIGNDFFSLIQAEKFNEAYNLLDEGFRSESFPTLTSYIDYCRKNYISKAGKIFTIKNFKKESENTYTAQGFLEEFEGNANVPIIKEYITLRYIDEKNYRLAFRQYVMTKNLMESAEYKGVKVTVTKATLYEDKLILKMEILNSNPNPIIIAQDNQLDIWMAMITKKKTSAKRGLALTEEAFEKADFSIKPGEKATFNFPFNVQISEKPIGIFFSNIVSGSEVVKTQILFKELW